MKPSLVLRSTTTGPGRALYASDIGKKGSAEAFVDKDGNINAGSKKELISIISNLATLVERLEGRPTSEEEATRLQQTAIAHREMLLAAWDDPVAYSELGDVVAETLEIAVDRNAFARTFLQQKETVQGSPVSVRIDAKEVLASIATGATRTQLEILRARTSYIQEFYIRVRPFVEERDLNTAPGDLLQETYDNSLSAILVQEDLTWKKMADELVGEENPMTNIAGLVTPEQFAAITSLVSRWGVSTTYALLASNIWQDLVSHERWADVFDPVSKFDILTTGRLGTLHGMQILSDHYRHPEHKVLDAGDLYIVGAPNQHGQYTDRNGVVAKPIDDTHEAVPGRGWSMIETMSMVIVNGRSIAKASRSS